MLEADEARAEHGTYKSAWQEKHGDRGNDEHREAIFLIGEMKGLVGAVIKPSARLIGTRTYKFDLNLGTVSAILRPSLEALYLHEETFQPHAVGRIVPSILDPIFGLYKKADPRLDI
jgi:hypothetical protein